MSGKFLCKLCGFSAIYDYLGHKPTFAKSMILLEEAYVLKDPFTDDKRCIILGSHCDVCRKSVCVSQDCSLFYTKRFCLPCVKDHLEEFPEEIKKEILKKNT